MRARGRVNTFFVGRRWCGRRGISATGPRRCPSLGADTRPDDAGSAGFRGCARFRPSVPVRRARQYSVLGLLTPQSLCAKPGVCLRPPRAASPPFRWKRFLVTKQNFYQRNEGREAGILASDKRALPVARPPGSERPHPGGRAGPQRYSPLDQDAENELDTGAAVPSLSYSDSRGRPFAENGPGPGAPQNPRPNGARENLSRGPRCASGRCVLPVCSAVPATAPAPNHSPQATPRLEARRWPQRLLLPRPGTRSGRCPG